MQGLRKLHLRQPSMLAQFSDAPSKLFLKHGVLIPQPVDSSNAVKLRAQLHALKKRCSQFKNGFAELDSFRHTRRTVKSVTIQINDLFEFEGQPIPAQRPDNGVIEDMARRPFEFQRSGKSHTLAGQQSRSFLATIPGENVKWRRRSGKEASVQKLFPCFESHWREFRE